MEFAALLLGRRLANREAGQQKIGILAGIAVFGLDGLASSAYGPEAGLTILMPLGAAGPVVIGPVMLAVLLLLAMLCLSYRQTIAAYPVNGGSYTVAKDNLGEPAGVVAAAALMLDYVLNVAVGISAGVAALVSAAPALHPLTLPLCLGVLAIITLANLRGLPEAGALFSLPTYLFLFCLGGVLAIGIVKAVIGTPPVVAPPPLHRAAEAVGAWIVLRAFASGCTAMTGVEAVSNGVGAFREPTVPTARHTLVAIVSILTLLLAVIAWLSRLYHVGAMQQMQPGYQSVLSQLAGAAIGRGPFYYVTIGSILAVLCLSANTSFVGFPRLCRLLAQDEFLPRGFAVVGRRLVASIGILFLASFAAALLIAFGGITDRLIPLFAVGAFLAFTLSQAGMARHWQKAAAECEAPRERRRHHTRRAVNGAGAIGTGVALLIIIVAKFAEGAWITLVAVPATILLLLLVKRHYRRDAELLRETDGLDLGAARPPIVVVPIAGWDRLAERAIGFAMRLSPEVVAVHLTQLEGPDSGERARAWRRMWREKVGGPAREAGFKPARLVLLHSPYRRFVAPLLCLIDDLHKRTPRRPIAVLVPELMHRHWWQYLLHMNRARHLRAALMRRGGPPVLVVEVPWYLEEPQPRPAPAEKAEARAARTALRHRRPAPG